MRQNKHFVTIVCLILGAVLLCSAAVANIGNAGGYEAYKKGLIGLLNMESYSGHGYVDLTLDGSNLVSARYSEKYNRDAKAGEAISYASVDGYSEMMDLTDGVRENWHVANADDQITGMPYTYYEYDSDEDSWYIDTGYNKGGIFSDFGIDLSDEYEQKMLRIAELAVDMFVGDLKNNFVYLGSEDGLKRYRVSLSGDQLPEIVQAVISLMFDNHASATVFGYNYASTAQVIDAIDLDWTELDEEGNYERYSAVRRQAWDMIFDEHDDVGVAVINKDLTISWYPTAQDYFKTIGNIPIDKLFTHRDLDYMFMLIDGEPRILNATCDLSVDSQGRLMANTLSGSVEFKLIDGSWHEVALTVHGEFDSRDSVEISLPVVNPKAARIVDYSRSCEDTDYEYTITENGATTTYHNRTYASDSSNAYYERFDRSADLHGYALINRVFGATMNGEIHYYTGALLSDPTGYYEIMPDTYVEASEFETLCGEWFINTQVIADSANELCVSPDMLMTALLEAYQDVTGKPFNGDHADFGGAHSENVLDSYAFEYGPFGFISLFATNMGLDFRYADPYGDDFTSESVSDFFMADAKLTDSKFGIVAVSADDVISAYYAMDDIELAAPIAESLGFTYDEAYAMFNAAYKCLCERSELFDAPDGVHMIPDTAGIWTFGEVVYED